MHRGPARCSPSPARNSTLDARLAALLVDVRIQGEPADAEVFVNGDVARQGAGERCSCPRAATHSKCARKVTTRTSRTWCSRRASAAPSISSSSIRRTSSAIRRRRITTKSGIRLLIVAGGTYQAGTDRREQGRRPNEGGHKVTLLRPFYMGEREVTNAQFRQFRDDAQLRRRRHSRRWISTSRRVSRVTWEDAAEFCNWLSAQEGLPPAYQPRDGGGFSLTVPVNNGYRLPTEGGVGIRRARREHRQAAQVSLGQGPARASRARPTSAAAKRSGCWARAPRPPG